MQDVWQSFSEEESKKHPIAEKVDFQTFTVTLPQERPQFIMGIILFPLIIAIFVAGFIEPNLMKPLLLVFGLLFPTAIVGTLMLRKYFTEEQVIELYNDKIVVKGVNAGTIFFSDIKAYGSNRDRWNINLTIQGNSTEDRIFSAPFRNGLEPFINAFTAKMQEQIKEKHYPIKKSIDWPPLLRLMLLGVFALFILLRFFHVI